MYYTYGKKLTPQCYDINKQWAIIVMDKLNLVKLVANRKCCIHNSYTYYTCIRVHNLFCGKNENVPINYPIAHNGYCLIINNMTTESNLSLYTFVRNSMKHVVFVLLLYSSYNHALLVDVFNHACTSTILFRCWCGRVWTHMICF